MKHPEKRKLRREKDVYLKIADILYFYKNDEADKEKTVKRLNFLKLIVKKKFNNENLLDIIEKAKDLIETHGKNAYDIFMKEYKIEELEKENSLLQWIK